MDVVFAFCLLAGGLVEWRLNWLVEFVSGVLCEFVSARRAMSGAGATLKMMRFLHFRSILFALLQAPGFGDGEAFTDKTFTDKACDSNYNNLMLEEMEVFAVSGYP